MSNEERELRGRNPGEGAAESNGRNEFREDGAVVPSAGLGVEGEDGLDGGEEIRADGGVEEDGDFACGKGAGPASLAVDEESCCGESRVCGGVGIIRDKYGCK